MPFYAVRTGRIPGIYNTWDECKQQVNNFAKARYKKFGSREEALAFVSGSDAPRQGTGGGFSRPGPTASGQAYGAGANNFQHSKSVARNIPHDIQLQIVEKETEYLREKLKLKESEKKLLQTKVEIEQLKGQAKQEKYQAKSPLTKHTLHTQKPYQPVSSASWKQNRTTQLLDSQQARHLYTSTHHNNSGSSGTSAVVYTDGACTNNGQGGAQAGIGVYWGPDHPLNVSERLKGRQTNNRAEIQAVVKAVNQAKICGFKDLTVKTDSMFLINSMTKWLPGWKAKGWKLASGGPVKNKEDFEDLIEAMAGIKVNWVHVAGHQGIDGNEQADRLAVQGANKPDT